jgi:SET domain-containing protein
MLLVKTRALASPIEGVGLFAAEPIAKGAIVWRFEPGIDLVVPEERIAALPEAAQAFFKRYAFPCPFFPGGLLLGFDNTRFVNHSRTPNLDNTGPETIALCDIAAGEELTTDYAELEPGYVLEPSLDLGN